MHSINFVTYLLFKRKPNAKHKLNDNLSVKSPKPQPIKKTLKFASFNHKTTMGSTNFALSKKKSNFKPKSMDNFIFIPKIF